MSYSYTETSDEGGRPVELFEFRFGALRWRYTNADRPLFAANEQYERLAIERSAITQTGEKVQDDLTITLPDTIPLLTLFKFAPPAEPIYLIVRSTHYGGGEAPIIWTGKVTTVGRRSIGVGELVCRTLTATMISSSARLTWDRNCPHMLYDEGCKVNRFAHADACTVETVSDDYTITVTGLDHIEEDYYSAGFIEWLIAPGTYDRRSIGKHTGSTFHLFGTADGVDVGTEIIAYPGCARTAVVCNDKFNNILNYGGYPHLPGNSPFDGQQVF